MSAAGDQMRQLTADSGYRDEYPIWSRDGRYILFLRLDGEDKASIWSIRLNDGELQKVVDEFDDDNALTEILIKSPKGKPAPPWFGYYGYIRWDQSIAWHQD